jgi:hypothetical protein
VLSGLPFVSRLLGPYPGTDVPGPACIPQALVSIRDELSTPATGFCVVLTRIMLHIHVIGVGRDVEIQGTVRVK